MQKDWKHRLHNWAPEPPQGGWERLSDALPHENSPAYAQKLYEFSATPPPAVWEALSTELNEAEPATPVVQMYPRKRWLQIASIAASILFAVYFLPSVFKEGQQSTASRPAPVAPQVLAPLPQQTPTTQNTFSEGASIADATPASKASVAYFNQMHLPPKSSGPLPIAEAAEPAGTLQSWMPENDNIRHIDDRMDRYIVLAVADDAAIRLPKKLYSAFRCEDHPDPAGCLDQLSQLRRQLAAPEQLASADFLGLMEVVRNMTTMQ